MTNPLIAYPDIPFQALTITPDATAQTDYGVMNLISGPRHRTYRVSGTPTTLEIKFDLGSGNSSPAEYVILARADKLESAEIQQFQLARSSDDSSYTDEVDEVPSGLYGTRSHDWAHVFTMSSAYRYWRATYTSKAGHDYRHSKLYFGSFFDFGKDCASCKIERFTTDAKFLPSSGSQIAERIDEPIYRYTFTWEGVTDAKINSFQSLIGSINHREFGVFLYCPTETQLLDGQNFIHTRITSFESKKGWNGWNDIRISFDEMLG